MQTLNSILEIASKQLPAAGVDCILIGGFAVDYYGYTRNTLDIDFMILTDQLGEVREIMTKAGFTNIIIQDTVAFFEKPGSAFRVDFLRVNKQTLQKLNNNAIDAEIYGYTLKVPALLDLIAMKIFALSQNLTRRMAKDLPDIGYLTVLNNLDLETDIKPICNKFGSPEIYELLEKQNSELRQ
jgi:hypothetical protein